jgi:hypothetical protein
MTDSTMKMSLDAFLDLVAHPDTTRAEGRMAFRDGYLIDANPWPPDDPRRGYWYEGWESKYWEEQ